MVLHVQETKTSAGKRKLPMTKEVEDCFRAIVDDRNAEKPVAEGDVVQMEKAVDSYQAEELKRLAEVEQARKEQEKLNQNRDDDEAGTIVAI